METPFIKKVKKIMDDPENADVISWNENKTMIEIRNQKVFEEKILARHFRHNRISSFIRQLNLYGFKKIRSAEYRTFTHPFLEKGLGLEAIINKKKFVQKNSLENTLNEVADMGQEGYRGSGLADQIGRNEALNSKRIPQNSNGNSEVQNLQKLSPVTSCLRGSAEPMLNQLWVIPMQQPTWKMPVFFPTENIIINYNCNTYRNWW